MRAVLHMRFDLDLRERGILTPFSETILKTLLIRKMPGGLPKQLAIPRVSSVLGPVGYDLELLGLRVMSIETETNELLTEVASRIWHVDCIHPIAERVGRVPNLQTPIGVEGARLSAFSLKVRHSSEKAYSSREAAAAFWALRVGFVDQPFVSQRARGVLNPNSKHQPFPIWPRKGPLFCAPS